MLESVLFITDNPINYRPIQFSRQFSKIIVKAVINRSIKYLNLNNILCNSQYDFRSGHNTTTALYNALDFTTKNYDNKTHTFSIFLDVAKAFNSVEYSILSYKLNHYGIRGCALLSL